MFRDSPVNARWFIIKGYQYCDDDQQVSVAGGHTRGAAAALGVKLGSRTESDGGFHRAEQQKQPHDLLFSSC